MPKTLCILLVLPFLFSACQKINENVTPKWQSLFNGKDLENWEVANFGGEGEVTIRDGQLLIDYGVRQSGIRFKQKLKQTVNYEIELEAMRIEGIDFFCGLSFPVSDQQCSLIVGGWGGTVVGLSNINGEDASNNETTNNLHHKNNKWHTIKLRVKEKTITVWINHKKVIDIIHIGKELGVRPEMDPVLPFGISCFQTKCAYRNIRYREL